MQQQYRSNFFYLSILLTGVIVAYWPVSFHVFSLKNDALTYFLPVRRLVSESWNHHIIPYWTPYLDLGYPIHGDMQSGVWSPIVQLFSLFGPYTLYTLQIETLLYVYLGGSGMFFLLKHFNVHPLANILSSFALMLCGFNTDSAQFLNWIAALAFLPFVILFYYRSLEERSVRMSVCTGLFLFIYFTTAYPADFILLAYLLLAILIWYSVTLKSINKTAALKKILALQLLIALIFLLLSAPAILSLYHTLPWMQRGTGATYAQAMTHPFHPFLVSSYLVPLAAIKMPGVDETNMLMRNSYIGIVPLLFVVSSFLRRSPDKFITFSKYAALIFLVFSFGEWGMVRSIAYYILPLMDSFRHPANARLFTIFLFCLLSAFAFHQTIGDATRTKTAHRSLLIVSAVAFIICIAAFIADPPGILRISELSFHQSTIGSRIKFLLDHLTFSDFLLINIIIQIPFIWLTKKWLDKSGWKKVAIVSIVNNVLFAMLFQPFTVVKNEKASYIQQLIDQHTVKGYPLPDLSMSLAENSADGMKYATEIGALNLYNKKIGRTDFYITPGNLHSQNRFWFDSKAVKEAAMNHPLFYVADSAVMLPVSPSLKGPEKYVFVEDSSLAKAINSLPGRSLPSVSITGFSPNRLVFRLSAREPVYGVLQQNYFPSWKVYIDGKAHDPDRVNVSFMGVLIPEGNHIVEFLFNARLTTAAWWISLATMVVVLVISSGTFFRNHY